MPKPASEILLKLREALAELGMWGEGDAEPFDSGPTPASPTDTFLFEGASWRRTSTTDLTVILSPFEVYMGNTYAGSGADCGSIRYQTPNGSRLICNGTIALRFATVTDAKFFADHYCWERRKPRQGDIVLMDELSNGINEGSLTPWTENHDDDVRLCLVQN